MGGGNQLSEAPTVWRASPGSLQGYSGLRQTWSGWEEQHVTKLVDKVPFSDSQEATTVELKIHNHDTTWKRIRVVVILRQHPCRISYCRTAPSLV